MAHRYAMLVDLRRCIGCQSCTVGCSVENQTPLGEFRTTVRQYEVINEQRLLPIMFYFLDYATIVITLLVCRFALYKQLISVKTVLL